MSERISSYACLVFSLFEDIYEKEAEIWKPNRERASNANPLDFSHFFMVFTFLSL